VMLPTTLARGRATARGYGFPTPAAYAAYTGRGYSSYPGFGLPSGIAGYPAGVVGILPSENRLPVTMGDFINLSLLSHT